LQRRRPRYGPGTLLALLDSGSSRLGGPPDCADFPVLLDLLIPFSRRPPIRLARRASHGPPGRRVGTRPRPAAPSTQSLLRQPRARLRTEAGILAELRPARIHTMHASADAAHDAAAGQLPDQGMDRHAARSHGAMENRGMRGGCDAHHRGPDVPAHSAAATE